MNHIFTILLIVAAVFSGCNNGSCSDCCRSFSATEMAEFVDAVEAEKP